MNNNSNNSIIATGIAILLSLVAIFVAVGGPTGSQVVGGERGGFQEFFDGVRIGQASQKWVVGQIDPGQTSVALYTNRTGVDVYADFGSADIPTGSTASTTQAVSLFATSSSATTVPTWANFGTLAEGGRALIQAVAIATSTTATSTNSVLSAVQGKGNGSVVIPDGSTLFGFMQQTYATVCTGSVCETATSTNRGFNPKFKVRLTTYGKSF